MLRRGDHRLDWPIALVKLQMGFDRTDKKALPLGELRKLQRRLGFGQRLQQCDVPRIGNLCARKRGASASAARRSGGSVCRDDILAQFA